MNKDKSSDQKVFANGMKGELLYKKGACSTHALYFNRKVL